MTRKEAIEILKEIRAINGTTRGTYAVALAMGIDALQAEPVKQGEWVNRRITKKDINHLETYGELVGYHDICSVCGFDIDEVFYAVGKTKYCPNCGAKMDKD